MPDTASARKEPPRPQPEMTATEANQVFGYLISSAAHDGRRTVITRFGRRIAAIVPISDLAILEKHAPAA